MLRTRTQSTRGPVGVITQVNDPGLGAVNPPVIVNKSQMDQTMIDELTPGFKRSKGKGIIHMNTCSNSKSVVTRSCGGYCKTTRNSDGLKGIWSGSGSLTSFMRAYYSCPDISISIPSDTNFEKAAKIKCLANLDKTPYSMAEDVATLREIVSFVRNPFGALLDLTLEHQQTLDRRGYRLSKRRKAARIAAETWNEYRFAYSPLMRTINDAFAAYSLQQNRYSLNVSHGRSEWEKETSDNYSSTGGIPRFTRYRKVTKQYFATAQTMTTNPVQDWRWRYGLRLQDVPRLAWDLVPYSFLVDRVLSVGDSISGLTNLSNPQLKILSACYTVKTVETKKFSFVDWVRSGWTSQVTPDTDTFETEVYNRVDWAPTVLDAIPAIMPGGLISDLSSFVDVLALTYQNLRRR